MAELQIPETLVRITHNNYLIDEEGYLLSHEAEMEARMQMQIKWGRLHVAPRVLEEWMRPWLPIVPIERFRQVPMCHPDEMETVARYFRKEFYRVLTIDANKVEDLEVKSHEALLNGEFFGKIHLDAILSEESFTWRRSKKVNMPDEAISFFREKEILEYTLGKAPYKQ